MKVKQMKNFKKKSYQSWNGYITLLVVISSFTVVEIEENLHSNLYGEYLLLFTLCINTSTPESR